MVETTYTVVCYDKDNDVYEKFGEFSVDIFALWKAKDLTKMMENGELKRKCSDGTEEPFDWVEIYKDWDEDTEEKVWTSYEPIWKEI